MQAFTKVIAFINENILWGIPLILAILGTGIYLTVRMRAMQVKKFPTVMGATLGETFKSVKKKGEKKEKEKDKKTVSAFEAFASAISGTVGTGNIVGVTGAIISGGPGAVLWMWISAFFGMITKYSENVLGMFFRKKDKNGEMNGGPMHYIEHGLKFRTLAIVFSLCCCLAAIGMGMVQANAISGTLQGAIAGDNTKLAKIIAVITGIVVVLVTALIVIGGIKRIGKVASVVVPFMAILFILMALVVITINISVVPKAFALIFKGAFSFRAVGGGFFGYTIMMAMRYGFARGVFSNEAGLGSSCIAHSASENKEPVKQGLWGILEVFIDTFVICTLTALSLLCAAIKTGLYDFTNVAGNTGLEKNFLAQFAFHHPFGTVGTVLFSIMLPLFAFTTILAWSYYGQQSVRYLFGKHGKVAENCFKVLYVGLLMVGAVVASDLVWQLDDMFNALMALPNLIALLMLGGLVVKITKNYFARLKGERVAPMLSADPALNAEFLDALLKEGEPSVSEEMRTLLPKIEE